MKRLDMVLLGVPALFCFALVAYKQDEKHMRPAREAQRLKQQQLSKEQGRED